MSRCAGLLVALVVVLLVGAPPPAAGARSFTIVPGKYGVKRIGPYKTKGTRRYSPTIRGAVRAFGRPSSRRRRRGGCVVKWRRLRLRIEFHNFGGVEPGKTICSDAFAQSFSAKGRKFRTWRGLRVGMSRDRMLELHPGAELFEGDRYQPRAWWLRQQISPFGDGTTSYSIVAARVRRGSVSRLDGWIGGAGE